MVVQQLFSCSSVGTVAVPKDMTVDESRGFADLQGF